MRVRREKLLRAAEGYLALDLPEQALVSLAEISDPEECRFDYHRLRGEALRDLARYKEALVDLERAFSEKPEDTSLLMYMAWCYKRTDALPKAIAAMEQAYRATPTEPIFLYNLACYWTLAGNKSQALSWLGRALRMDKSLRALIPDEHDFDALRSDPDFQAMISTPDDRSHTAS